MAATLTHELTPHFPKLARFSSTRALELSTLFQDLKPQIEAVLQGYEHEVFAATAEPKETYRAVAWNIERGRHFKGVKEILGAHPELAEADVFLITESDLGMARSANRNVARELCQELGFNYFFAPSYLNLSKGCGHEVEYEGENEFGIHGNAIFSRYPLSNFRTVVLPNGKDKMRGNEKRIGLQRALICDVALGNKTLTLACAHLDAHSSQLHRKQQLEYVIEQLDEIPRDQAVLIGGDWNTSTYNSSRAVHAIIGFWVRVFHGIDNMVGKHYPCPERFWEKELFEMLELKGFDYKGPNDIGAGTLIYDINDYEQEKNLKEWVPDWCFPFIEWSLRNHNGRLQFKLDWFAARNLQTFNPKVVEKLIVDGKRASDHAAIVTEFKL